MREFLLRIEPVIWLLFGQGLLVGTMLLRLDNREDIDVCNLSLANLTSTVLARQAYPVIFETSRKDMTVQVIGKDSKLGKKKKWRREGKSRTTVE